MDNARQRVKQQASNLINNPNMKQQLKAHRDDIYAKGSAQASRYAQDTLNKYSAGKGKKGIVIRLIKKLFGMENRSKQDSRR